MKKNTKPEQIIRLLGQYHPDQHICNWRERENFGAEPMREEIMAENLSKVEEDIKRQIQEFL